MAQGEASKPWWRLGLCTIALLLIGGAPARGDIALRAGAAEVALNEGLAVSDVASWGRRAINPDAIAEAMARGTLGRPREGDAIKRPEAMGAGVRMWRAVRAVGQGEEDGAGFTAAMGLERGSYVLFRVSSERERVMLLEARGNSVSYVNGEPHAGDPYSHGYLRVPVLLSAGENQIVLGHAGRKAMRARLLAPPAEVFANIDDLTLPDVISTEAREYWLGVPVVNASVRERTVRLSVVTTDAGATAPEERLTLPPLTVRKVPVRARLRSTGEESEVGAAIVVREGDGEGEREVSRQSIALRAIDESPAHCRTFVSAIDGSVQYCAIVPPTRESKDRPGLVVSLHGAGVEARSQAPCYAPKPDFVVVCPTNRRPFGFDWEEWGRVDAIEAMEFAAAEYGTDPRKQYLTGHSMGGHGAWHIGSLMPERFAAVAPSAGWLTFDTYAPMRGEPTDTSESALRAMFRRATSASDTLALMPNLRGVGVYVLHGDQDDNVPVSESRRAREELDRIGLEFTYHEQPGVSHWWDDDKGAPGIGCVDWAGFFEMFRSCSLPAVGEQREFHVRTLQVGVAMPLGDGVRIMGALSHGRMATADVRVESADDSAGVGRIVVTTSNVAALSLGERVVCSAPQCEVMIDGQTVHAERQGSHVRLVRRGIGSAARWEDMGAAACTSADGTIEGAASVPACGPLKNAFTNRFVMVFGTQGTEQENRWAMARVRFDSEQWWYRGNGRAEIVSDEVFLRMLDEGRVMGNAVLYGNEETNSAAGRLCPVGGGEGEGQAVRVKGGEARVGDRSVRGEDVGVLGVGTFVCGTGKARMYALVGGTGVVGMRATDRFTYLISGVGVPDVCLVRAGLWDTGAAKGGVECAGFLGSSLTLDGADLVWHDPRGSGRAAGK